MVLIGCQIQRWNCVELRNWVTACFILPTGKWYGMIWALCRCSADSDLILTLPKKKAGAFHPTISNRYFLATTANVWKICCLFLLPLRLGPGQSVPEEPTGVWQLKCWRSHIPYRCAEILSTSNIQQVNNIVVVLLGVHLYSFNSLRLNLIAYKGGSNDCAWTFSDMLRWSIYFWPTDSMSLRRCGTLQTHWYFDRQYTSWINRSDEVNHMMLTEILCPGRLFSKFHRCQFSKGCNFPVTANLFVIGKSP